MKKFWTTVIILILIVIVAFLISPYFIGNDVQQRVKTTIPETLNQSPFVTVKLKNYDKGWFSSKGELAVSSPFLSTMTDSKPIPINFEIVHGPWVTANGQDGQRHLHFAIGSINLNSDTPNLKATGSTLFKIGGGIDTNLNVQNLLLDLKNGGSFSMQQLMATAQSNPDDQTASFSGKTKTMTLQLPSHDNTALPVSKIQINDYTLDWKGKKILPNVWLGPTTASINNITVESGGAVMGKLNDISVDNNTEASNDNKTLTFSGKLKIGSINIALVDYTIKPFEIDHSISGVDAKAFSQFMSVVIEMDKNLDQPPSDEMMKQLQESAIKLVSNGITFDISHFNVGLQDQTAPLSGSMKLVIKPLKEVLQQAALNSAASSDDDNEKSMLEKAAGLNFKPGSAQDKIAALTLKMLKDGIEFNLNLSMPRKLVAGALNMKYSEELAKLAAKGKVVTSTPNSLTNQAIDVLLNNDLMKPGQNDTLTMTLHFNNGQLSINGKERSIESLKTIDMPNPWSDYQKSQANNQGQSQSDSGLRQTTESNSQ